MNLPSWLRIISALFLVWLVVSAVYTNRLQTSGAFASAGTNRTLEYVKEHLHANPANVRLDKSYTQWALDLHGTDTANYLKGGLGFAEGHGVSLKEITPEQPSCKTYVPFYYQAPGTPILIGIMIKLFGEQHVWPYYLLVLCLHFATASLACLLASRYIRNEALIFGAGLLSLICLPVLSFNLGLGLFCGEPAANLFIGLALFFISTFWNIKQADPVPYKRTCLIGIVCGFCLAIAAYFREIYTSFAQFSLVALLVLGLFDKVRFKQIALFSLIAWLTLSAVEYPWEKRNQKFFNEFTMAGSTYYGYALWYFIWD